MPEHVGIESVKLRLVDIWLENTLAKIIEHDVLDTAPERTKRLLVEPGPGLGRRLPDHFTKAAAGVPQSHHEKPGSPVVPRHRMPGQRALSIIHLRLLAGAELESIKLLRCFALEATDEALDAVVAGLEAMAVHKLLKNRLRVALESHLLFDPGAVRFTGRSGMSRNHRAS
jgi:hypothetical protein